jgi:restriction system protein
LKTLTDTGTKKGGAYNPESCFKKLKGISATKLIDLTPVAPLLKIEKSDSRFIESRDVLQNVNEGVNLASMNWEEFEHLIREIFSKEFTLSGGEVKVTQSSRDGGVDAVAFDPDPIRGGKIIIQAKRYTNIVGLSAVRDLYGTVMNEGANKGIIVTTSYFGKDAYDFAKNKPLSLIDGSNLLYLLGKHGYKAKIDINEAKSNYTS